MPWLRLLKRRLPKKPPATPMARLLQMLGCCGMGLAMGCDGDGRYVPEGWDGDGVEYERLGEL
jgi:hypothetical protein